MSVHPLLIPGSTLSPAEDGFYRVRRAARSLNAISAMLLIGPTAPQSMDCVRPEDLAALLEWASESITQGLEPMQNSASPQTRG